MSKRAPRTEVIGFVAFTVVMGCGPEEPISEPDMPPPPEAEVGVPEPPSAAYSGVPCALTQKLFLTAILQERENWYGRHLAAAGEGNLCVHATDSTEVYRFTWLRTFHPPVIIRVELSHGEIQLYAKQLTGAGGYDPGVLQTNRAVRLSSAQRQEFRQLLQRVAFWSAGTSENDPQPRWS
jgi:hypothetical protein